MAKTKYETQVEPKIDEISSWAREGMIDKDIASKLNIAYSTFREYVKKHSALSAALKTNKEQADAKVESSLFKKTQGYNVPIKKTFKCKKTIFDKNTGRKVEEIEELKEGFDEVHVPADTTSIIFWLKNRKPDIWKDKRDVEMGGKDGEPLSVNFGIPRPEKE
ncbi:helix-turn-helix transcriptional regulator [Anaerovorax sp. IOR16]|uniref:helix-turn-helix transcriptional regulator n=1 Tax=Anaerovorax sp. IOR16 TaxID=2773458 RepID=UPI0019D165AD|nr:hypothetical protein [Anaerovorax sp. IOR16]